MGSKASNCKSRHLHHFSSVLSQAFLEWALMILLFLNGFFSYLVTKFARANKLQPPCLLCSRLDHVIGRTEPTFHFHRDLLCDSHKLELSNWAFCHAHGQLADLRSMCEKCLFSFFLDEKLENIGAYHSILGNVGMQINHDDASQVPLLKEENESETFATQVTKTCSCCNEPIDQNQNKERVFKSLHDMRNRNRDEIESVDLTKIGTNQKVVFEKDTNHLLTHVEYNELKTSDSDSELHVNDTLISSREIQVSKDIVNISDDKDSSNETRLMEENNLDESNHTESHCTESEEKENDISNELSQEDLKGSIKKETPTISEDKLTPLNPPPTLPTLQNPSPNPNPNPNPNAPNLPPSPCGSISLSDAYTLATSHKLTKRSSSLTSPKFEDIISGKDSSRVYDDLKLLISQLSAARGVDSPWTDIAPSPRLQQGDEHVLNNISKTLTIERNESNLSSWEGSMVSEVEGEGAVERLKRQVDLDRKSIGLLYRELEEERNASAIAANQAMAMITRLQEEKAAMQMEALQYQRMVEEQAEYDQEALQRCHEIISQKDRTIQELEIELVAYRDRVVNDQSDLSLLGFEEQKAYISDRLSDLEEKLHIFSNNSSFFETTKLDSIEEEEEGEEEERESTSEKENYRRENGPVQKRGSVRSERSPNPKDLVDLGEEISQICERLKALEADHNFLEHSLNSIKNGQEGVRFIYDIALSLQELRSLGITHGNKDD
ncbi:hypothetical protein LUZ60_010188 [Juncus effusus]|nr:hypothetical protein LUZ60_010188 [Juncus effusus]